MLEQARRILADPGAPAAQPVRRILVVDDSRVQRRILGSYLAGLGYEVVEAASGREALDGGSGLPDMVISGWVMPGLDGLDLCRALRERGGSYVYFILLTSRSDKEDIARGLDAGADDFLAKPVALQELRARVAAGERILTMERELVRRNEATRAALGQLRVLYDALDRDLDEARKFQQSLVRQRRRIFAEGDVSLMLRPSGAVGGDLVGLYRIGESGLGLYGIDVSGHGVASALLTARLAGYLTGHLPASNVALRRDPRGGIGGRPVGQVAAILNRRMIEEVDTGHYFTMILAHVHLPTGEVSLVQAGHPAPLVQGRDGTVRQVGEGGMPIGLFPDARFGCTRFRLCPGERLLMVSDGFSECPDPEGRQLGDAGLVRLVEGAHGLQGGLLLDTLVWALSGHAGSREIPDDLSAVLLEYRGPGPPAES